jgi:predicted nucleotidyltransferase
MGQSSEIAKRRRLAEMVAPAYAANSKVASVLLAGSVARGTADRFSDIEIDVYWHTPPNDADLLAPIEQSGWRLLYRHVDEYEWADGFSIEGVKVDTSQFLVSTLDRWIDDVMERADLEVEKQLRISAIRHGQPLYGAELIERWRERTATYPEALRHAMVREHLEFRPRELLEMFAARDNTLILYRSLVEISQRILDVLMALNRIYLPHPYHKWLDWEVAQLPIGPPDLAGRLRTLLRAKPETAADEIHRLIEETFALVERHMPEIDTRPLRAEFETRRVTEANTATWPKKSSRPGRQYSRRLGARPRSARSGPAPSWRPTGARSPRARRKRVG